MPSARHTDSTATGPQPVTFRGPDLIARWQVTDLPADLTDGLVTAFFADLELLVGSALVERLAEGELEEFEALVDAADEPAALNFLATHVPEYRAIVEAQAAELSGLVAEAVPAIRVTSNLAQATGARGMSRAAPLHRTPLPTGTGTALDPRHEHVTWVGWVLKGSAEPANDGAFQIAASVLRNAAEALWLPGRLVAMVDLHWDPVGPQLTVRLAIGLLGSPAATGEVAVALDADLEHVQRHIAALLNDPSLPFSVRPSDPAQLFLPAGDPEQRHTALIRQRLVDIEVPAEGGSTSISLLTRFNPVLNSIAAVARVLATRQFPTRFRATVIPTELGPDERADLDAQLRLVAAARARIQEHPEHDTALMRAQATLSDLKASFATPLFVAELALASPAPLPETFVRAVGAAHTSEIDVLRRGTHTTVAGQSLLLGGFDPVLDPPGLAEALARGLPLHGGMHARTMREVVSLTEFPLALPLPVNRPIPGLRSLASKERRRPAAFSHDDAAGLSSPTPLGLDPGGASASLTWQQRITHTCVTGATGSGKSTLLDRLLEADLRAPGRAIVLFDFHGSLVERARARCRELGRHPIVLDVTDPGTARIQPVPPLLADPASPAYTAELERAQTAARLFCDATTSHLPNPEWHGPTWNRYASAALEVMARYCVELVTVLEWLSDPEAARHLAGDRALTAQTRTAIRSLSEAKTANELQTVGWVAGKWTGLTDGPGRRLLARPGGGTDLARAVLSGQVVLVSLAGLAEQDASTIAHVLLQQIIDAVLGAGPSNERQVAVVVDEAHRVEPHNLERAWTQGRKFGLSLTVATQTHQQFSGTTADLALSAGTFVAFRQPPSAAERLGGLMRVPALELVHQPDLHAFVASSAGEVCTVELAPYATLPDLPPRAPLAPQANHRFTPSEALEARPTSADEDDVTLDEEDWETTFLDEPCPVDDAVSTSGIPWDAALPNPFTSSTPRLREWFASLRS